MHDDPFSAVTLVMPRASTQPANRRTTHRGDCSVLVHVEGLRRSDLCNLHPFATTFPLFSRSGLSHRVNDHCGEEKWLSGRIMVDGFHGM